MKTAKLHFEFALISPPPPPPPSPTHAGGGLNGESVDVRYGVDVEPGSTAMAPTGATAPWSLATLNSLPNSVLRHLYVDALLSRLRRALKTKHFSSLACVDS